MKQNKFKCIEFDDDNNRINILIGDKGFVNYKDIEKVSLLNEDAKFRGKTQPFVHQVLGGTTFYTIFGEPSFYVGLKIVLKDHTIKAAYISDRTTRLNTDIYKEDVKEGNLIKRKIEKRIS